MQTGTMKYMLTLLLFFFPFFLISQNLTAEEIIRRSEDNLRGGTSYAEMKMTIIRPEWSRETKMKSWSKGKDLGLIRVTSPARDQGISYLKRNNEIWNWQPKIERTIKLPPSMMSNSWMGSDFTNDDLVRESSLVDDYTQTLIGEEKFGNLDTYKLELTPRQGAAVVWGKLFMWISKEHFMQIKTEFYDEDGFLINTMTGSDFSDFDGRYLPRKLTVVPEDEPGNKTIVTYISLDFNQNLSERFFTIQNMKNIQ